MENVDFVYRLNSLDARAQDPESHTNIEMNENKTKKKL